MDGRKSTAKFVAASGLHTATRANSCKTMVGTATTTPSISLTGPMNANVAESNARRIRRYRDPRRHQLVEETSRGAPGTDNLQSGTRRSTPAMTLCPEEARTLHKLSAEDDA